MVDQTIFGRVVFGLESSEERSSHSIYIVRVIRKQPHKEWMVSLVDLLIDRPEQCSLGVRSIDRPEQCSLGVRSIDRPEQCFLSSQDLHSGGRVFGEV